MKKLVSLAGLSLVSFQAAANLPTGQVPEPGMLPLLGAGLAAVIAVRFLRKEK